jgi:hypothetical protein
MLIVEAKWGGQISRYRRIGVYARRRLHWCGEHPGSRPTGGLEARHFVSALDAVVSAFVFLFDGVLQSLQQTAASLPTKLGSP